MIPLYFAAGFADTFKVIEKVVSKYDLHDKCRAESDLRYWLSRTPQQRGEAVEFLRAQQHGRGARRLQRVARVIPRP